MIIDVSWAFFIMPNVDIYGNIFFSRFRISPKSPSCITVNGSYSKAEVFVMKYIET